MNRKADAAEALIDHALALRWDRLARRDREAACAFLLDTLAVGAAGRNAAHAETVLSMASRWGLGDEASVLGRPGLRLPAGSAAFVNAFQIHGQEFDCVHEPAVLHPLSSVLAAVLAEAERGGPVSGEDFLTALVAGVDVAATLGIGAGPTSFFRPAVAGINGSVAAVAALRGMPRQEALHALGHALAFASGTMQAHVEGKPALPVQVANAARASLVAVDLARGGVEGVENPIEGPFGYYALLERSAKLSEGLDLLAKGSRIAEVSWKPYPTGRAGHGGIVALLGLMAEEGLAADQVAGLDYHAPPLIRRLVGRPAGPGMAPGYARLCLPYLAAVTLMRGGVGLSDFSSERLSDPAILELAARITVVDDGNPDTAAFAPGRMKVRLIDGRQLEKVVSVQFGSPEWPLTPEQRLDKARACLEFAGLPKVAEPLADVVVGLETQTDAVAALRRTGII